MVDWYALQNGFLWVEPFIIDGAILVIASALTSVAISHYRMLLHAKRNKPEQVKEMQELPTEREPPREIVEAPVKATGSPNVAVGLALANVVRSVINETGLDQQQAISLLGHMLNKMKGGVEKEIPQDTPEKFQRAKVQELAAQQPNGQTAPRTIEQEVVSLSSEIEKLNRDEESVHKRKQDALQTLDNLKSKIPAIRDAVVSAKKDPPVVLTEVSEREEALKKFGSPAVVETPPKVEAPEPSTGFHHAIKGKKSNRKKGEDFSWEDDEQSTESEVAEPGVPRESQQLPEELPEVQVKEKEAEQPLEKTKTPKKRKRATEKVEGTEVDVDDFPSIR